MKQTNLLQIGNGLQLFSNLKQIIDSCQNEARFFKMDALAYVKPY
jgi:hypothetical protein